MEYGCGWNQKPLNWLIDTGASLTIIDQSGENQIGLYPVDESRPGPHDPRELELYGFKGGGVGDKFFHVLLLDELKIGERTWHHFYVTGSNIEITGGNPHELPLHGILGDDALVNVGALIDPREGVMWFRPDRD